MHRDRNALKSGVFIILTVAMIIAIIVGIKGAENLSRPKDLRAVSFTLKDDVGGLQPGDDVRVGGFKVGSVKDIDVVDAEKGAKAAPYIRVTFSFPTGYVVHDDAVLRIQSTVTGQSCLNFESLGTGAALPREAEITGRPGVLTEVLASVGKVGPILDTVQTKTLPTVNDTVGKFGKTAESFTATGDHATKLVDDARGQVDPAMKHYHAVMDSANAALDAIHAFFGSTTTDFRTTLAKVASITTTIEKKTPGMVDKIDAILGKVDTAVASTNEALENVKKAVADTKDITGSAKSVIVGNRGKLDAMIASLKATGKNLESATVEIRRSPWRLLYKPAPNEMANLNLYDAARQFAEGASELNDASAALRDAVQSDDADKADVERLMKKLETSFDNFQKVENDLVTKVKE